MNDEANKSLQEKNPTIAYLSSKVGALETMLPANIPPKRFLRIVFLQLQKNPKLMECTPESVYAAIMEAAERGLIPDGRQGWLVPYKNNKKGVREAQFQVGYLGIFDRARRSGEIADIFVASIHENDEFSYELGFNRSLIHKPALRGDRGSIIAVYCVVEFRDGTKTFGPGPMTVDEVENVRARSRSRDEGPWVTDWESMAWKTVGRRTLKFCPQSSDDLRQIIELDNEDYEEIPQAQLPQRTMADLMAPTQEQEQQRIAPPQTQEPYTMSKDEADAITDAAKTADNKDEPEWPKWHEEAQNWYGSDGVFLTPGVHPAFPSDGKPSVNADGTLRAGRGKAIEAKELAKQAKAKEQKESGELDRSTTPKLEVVLKDIEDAKDEFADGRQEAAFAAIDLCDDLANGLPDENERQLALDKVAAAYKWMKAKQQEQES